MLNIRERPYALLLFTAIAFLLALVFLPIARIDLQDTTLFSVPSAVIVWIIPLLLLFFWLLYLLTKRFLYSMTITWIHVLITIFATILLVTVLYIGIVPSQLKNNRHELIGNAIQILSLIFVFGQLTYVANVLLGLFAKRQIDSR